MGKKRRSGRRSFPHGHGVHRYLDDDGYIASCSCGWRIVEPTSERRDAAMRKHLADVRRERDETRADR